jgi:hypothetical protein
MIMRITKEQREELKDWITIAAIALAGAWALWTFFYEQRLKHYLEPSYLRATVSIEPAAQTQSSFELAAQPILIRLSVENQSKRLVRVLSGQVELHADRLLLSDEAEFSPENLAATLDVDKAHRSRYWNKRESQLVFTGSAFRMWTFEPGEKQEFSRLVWVPQAKFHQLEANVYIKSTPSNDDICLTHLVNAKFETDTLPGRLVGDECKALPAKSKEAEAVLQQVGTVDSTAFLALPSSQVASAPAKSPTLKKQ